jgi:hypothetical protein
MKRTRGTAWLGVFAALVACAAARATTLMRMPVEKMARTAEVVVRARCVANVTGWDAGEIWTVTTFQIEETWKGAPGVVITVGRQGGKPDLDSGRRAAISYGRRCGAVSRTGWARRFLGCELDARNIPDPARAENG